MDHQRVAVESMIDMQHFALLMEMGTGKTPVVCWELDHYWNRLGDDDIFKGLVICPKPLRENWRRELNKFTSDTHDSIIRIVDSAVAGAKGLLELIQDEANIKVAIMSYDSVRSLRDHLKLFCPDYMVLDESHYVKSASTQRWKNIIEIADVMSELGKKKRILTGTPVSNKVSDLWPQFEILKRGVLGANTLKGFVKQYAECDKIGDWTVVKGYKNVDRLRELMARNSFIVKKSECMDLPDKMYETRYVDMPPKMRKLYDDYYTNLSVQIGNHKLETDFMIAQLMKLSQMCSGFVRVPKLEKDTFTLDGKALFEFTETVELETVEIPGGDTKLNEMMSEAVEIVKESKLIIWARFHHDIDAISFNLQMAGIRHVKYDGRMNSKKQQEAVDAFNEIDDVRVFIGQQQAGGVGLTLLGNTDNYYHTCRTVYFYSNSYSYMQRSQAEDRCHRHGQKNKVTYVDWCYARSIDEAIASCLQSKKELADMIKDVEGIKDLLIVREENEE